MIHRPSRISRYFRLFGKLGSAEGRRRAKAGSQGGSESLETRQMLAADLSKVIYNTTLLDQDPASTTVDSYFVAFNRVISAGSVKSATGARTVKPFALIPNSFNLQFDTAISLQEAADSFSAISGLQYLNPNLPLERVVKFVPNDPLFASQWHLDNTGQTGGTSGSDANITGVWDTHTGAGVVIGIVDDGVQLAHPDLAANVANGLSFDYVSNDSDPTPAANSGDNHGTAVAGVAAGVGNNSLGITGAAYEASIAGIRLLGFPQTATTESSALTHRNQSIDIYNNSWGPTDIPIIAALPPQVEAALSNGTRLGRGGLGSIYTWAGGNGRAGGDYSNYDQYASSRFVIAVGAIDHNGRQSTYSESGSNLLISAYSSSPGIVTTDIVGADGYDATDYTNTFGGTSSATPLVSGVIALMLEANPNLSYRDVMDILARTAEHNDPTDAGWTVNGAGLQVNHKYGFGAIDAQAAVSAALTHNPLGPLASRSTPVVRVNRAIPDNTPSGTVATVTTNVQLNLEHVELVLNAAHQNRGDLAITLVSPGGTRSIMTQARTQDTGNDYRNWVFTTTRNWGERSDGTWTVEIADLLTGTTGTFTDFQLRFHGTELPLSLSINPGSIAENGGKGAATGTVTRGAGVSLAQSLLVSLSSNDTSEARVPALVRIPAGAASVTFPIHAIDDKLADGTQRVDIQASATINGTLNSVTSSLNVLDHETLTMKIDKTEVSETAGKGAAVITITRSNTDVAEPNTYSVVNNRLIEHDPSGVQVGNPRVIPWPTGTRPVGEIARDLVVMENGRIAVHNGTTTGYVSILNPANNTWQHIHVPGLSSDPSVSGSGGISSSGDYVFLSDMSTSSNDPFGVVRVDTITQTVTRFADRSLGYRMFVKDVFGDSIVEFDLQTGATINTIPLPAALGTFSDFDNGMAFDGTSLWLTGGSLSPNSLYKIDPDNGAVLETHFVSTLGVNTWEGMAWLNDQLYLLSGGISSIIAAYDPAQRRITNTLDIDSINSTSLSIWKGLAGIKGPDRLVATTILGDLIVEIDPRTGVITNQWQRGISATPYGIGAADGEIYIGEFLNGTVEVFNRQGVLQRIMDVNLASLEGLAALGGDDVEGLVPTDYRYRDIDSGLDGEFYALDAAGVTLGRFNSNTLALDEFFDLSAPVNAIAVAADGSIWGAGGDGILYHFDATGAILEQLTIASASLVDIDLNVSGQILMTSSAGRVYKTDTSLVTPTSFATGSTLAYGSFGRHQTLPSGDLLIQLTNSDPTEASIPGSVVIPVGQRSVTVSVDAIDDSFFDGTQTVDFTASAIGYSSVASVSLDVLDAESVEVDIVAGAITESAGPGATQARIYRTDIDGPFTYVGPRQVLTNSTTTTILDFDKTNSYITVPEQTSRLTDVNVTLSLTHSFLSDLDIYLVSPGGTRVELVTDLVSNETEMTGTIFDDGARTSILTGESPYTGRFRPEGSLLDLNGENPAGVWTLEITDDNRTDFGTLNSWTLSLETVGLAALTVSLAKTGDTNEIGIPGTVVIPANQSEVFIPVDAIDDNILDGTRIAGIRTIPRTAGYFSGSDTIKVLDRETLLFSVDKSTVAETAGAGALTGKLVRLNSDRTSSFTVSLTSSDTSELTVPATVTIPAGRSTVTFPISAVDDAVFDGTQTVTIRAVAPQYIVSRNQVISVTDVEPKLVLSSNVSTIEENAGSFSVTVTRQQQTDISQPVTVNLAVSAFTGQSSPIQVPSTVTIPAGLISQTFLVTVNDDRLLDGAQTATILATSPGITETSAEFTITDYETLSLSISRSSVREDNGAAAAIGTVTRSNLDNAFPLTVTLTSSDRTEIRVPTTVTIPVGASSVSFDIDAINDPALDGTQTVTITAAAALYVGDSRTINVDDHEPPVVTAPAPTSATATPVVTWKQVPNALRYEVLLQNLSTGVEQLYNGILETSFAIEQPKAEPLGIGRYRVFVRAVDQLEQPGYWSAARNFRVVTAPVFTAPAATSSVVSGTFPEIAWTAVFDAAGDAAGYELFVHNLTSGKKNVIVQKNLTTTSYKATEDLGSGSYQATVRAFRVFNSRKEYGNFSTPLDFTVLAAPGILTPVGGGTFDRSPVLSWSAVAGASTYDVMVQNSQTKEVVFRDRSVPGTSIRIPQDLSDATYTVRVRAQSGRLFSGWSEVRSFSVGASPEITSPAANAKAGAQPKFVWTSISGAERYEIRVLNKDTNAYVIQVDSITRTSFTPSKKLPLGEYEVTVRAISVLGDITDWSDAVSFIGGTPPVITSPTNNSSTPRQPAIVWSAVDGAAAYTVKIVNLANNATVVLTEKLTGTTFTPATSLAAEKYRIWVRAISAEGHSSSWSSAVDITVAGITVDEELTRFGNPVVAAILPTRAAVIVSSRDAVSEDSDSSVRKFVVGAAHGLDEPAGSADPISEADFFAAATDEVMAAWDVSELWNATPIPRNHRNQTL